MRPRGAKRIMIKRCLFDVFFGLSKIFGSQNSIDSIGSIDCVDSLDSIESEDSTDSRDSIDFSDSKHRQHSHHTQRENDTTNGGGAEGAASIGTITRPLCVWCECWRSVVWHEYRIY